MRRPAPKATPRDVRITDGIEVVRPKTEATICDREVRRTSGRYLGEQCREHTDGPGLEPDRWARITHRGHYCNTRGPRGIEWASGRKYQIRPLQKPPLTQVGHEDIRSVFR